MLFTMHHAARRVSSCLLHASHGMRISDVVWCMRQGYGRNSRRESIRESGGLDIGLHVDA
jgi:hypothetical protein